MDFESFKKMVAQDNEWRKKDIRITQFWCPHCGEIVAFIPMKFLSKTGVTLTLECASCSYSGPTWYVDAFFYSQERWQDIVDSEKGNYILTTPGDWLKGLDEASMKKRDEQYNLKSEV